MQQIMRRFFFTKVIFIKTKYKLPCHMIFTCCQAQLWRSEQSGRRKCRPWWRFQQGSLRDHRLQLWHQKKIYYFQKGGVILCCLLSLHIFNQNYYYYTDWLQESNTIRDISSKASQPSLKQSWFTSELTASVCSSLPAAQEVPSYQTLK